MSEKERLLELLRKEGGFKEFLNRYTDLIFNTIRYFTRDEEERSDIYLFVVEALFKTLVHKLEQFDGNSSFSTYFTSIVRNLVLDYFRRHKKQREIDKTKAYLDDELLPLPDESQLSPEEEFFAKIAKEDKKRALLALKEMMKELSEREQLLLTYRFVDKLKGVEIVPLMGFKSEKEAFNALTKLLRGLRKKFGEEGIE